jgi:hypothetical protein
MDVAILQTMYVNPKPRAVENASVRSGYQFLWRIHEAANMDGISY